MKILMSTLAAILLLSCNNSKTDSIQTDSLSEKSNRGDSLHITVADSASNEYSYVTDIEKRHDSIFIKADYVQFFNGPNVVEEAKKRHQADTSYDKKGKIEDIFVPDDYFIVNDDKELRSLYLPVNTPITMDSEIAGHAKNINTYPYFSQHFKNSLFVLTEKNNMISAIKEVFLP